MGVDASEMTAFGGNVRRRALRVGAAGSAVVRKSTFDIEREAKARCPVAPIAGGTLRNSGSSSFSGDGRFGSVTGEVSFHTDYAIFVHDGTSKMAGRPWLAQAFDANLPSFEKAVAKLGGEILP